MVTERIVDHLETIEVDEHQRDPVPFAASHGQRLVEQLLQAEAVEQTGQHVVMGNVVQPLFRGALGRDIGEVRDVVAGIPLIVTNQRNRHPLRIDPAVLAPVPDLALPETALVDVVPHPLILFPRRPAGRQKTGIAPDRLLGAVAGQGGKGRIDGNDLVVSIGDQDRLAAVLDGTGQQMHLRFGLLLLRDVLRRADRPQRRTVRAELGLATFEDVFDPAIRQQQTVPDRHRMALVDRLVQRCIDGSPVFRMHLGQEILVRRAAI